MNRSFALALGVSLAGHVVIVGAQIAFMGWSGVGASVQPKVIYDARPDQDERWEQAQRLYRVQAQLADMSSTAKMPQAVFGSSQAANLRTSQASAWAGLLAQLTSGRGLSRYVPGTESAGGSLWTNAVDLTNLASAARGNPVLLSYFSAIREQIQRTADRQDWLSHRQLDQGIVYVGFVIARNGRVTQTSLLKDRSVASSSLAAAAVNIIRASSPFPEFPPSSPGPAMALIVPLEFVLSPAGGEGSGSGS